MTEDDILGQARADLLARRAKLSPAQQALLDRRLRGDEAQASSSDQAGQATIPRRADHGPVPLSFAQQRLWFFDQLEPNSATYNLAHVLRLSGPLNIAALGAALNDLVARHEVLRTIFVTHAGEPRQQILDRLALPLPLDRLDHLPPSERSVQTEQYVRAEVTRPFDLMGGPLMRARVLRLEEATHLLVLTVHHIVADGWSFGVLVQEIAALYTAAHTGGSAPLPALPIQYADYAVWQRESLNAGPLQEHLRYWTRQLAGSPELLALPTDAPRPAAQSYKGASCEQWLSAELREALLVLGQREGVTLFMTLLAGFQALLARYSGQDDVVVGTAIAGRTRPELEHLIGCFINTLPLRTSLAGDPTVRELLGRVRAVALEAYAHQEVPFEQMVDALQPERDLSHSPIFQVLFVLQNAPQPSLQVEGLHIASVEEPSTAAKFDLTLVAHEASAGLRLNLEYSTDLFTAATASQLLAHYEQLLSAMVAAPERRLSALDLLTGEERERVLGLGAGPALVYPANTGIADLFFAQAARTPDVLALDDGATRLRYAALATRVARLAHVLQARGVGPDRRVGVCLERGNRLVEAVLAVLAAGGAYVPLDPNYPAARRRHIIEDADLALMLTETALAQTFGGPQSIPLLVLDADDVMAAVESAPTTLRSQAQPDNLAYVIYTSGSTGTPKGVMISQRNVVNFFAAMQAALGGDPPGVWLAATSVSFDISVLELLWTLVSGAQVVVQTGDVVSQLVSSQARPRAARPIDWSLFYFASAENTAAHDKYRLLLDGAKFADQHGFTAVWVPERHFHSFGGLYPNPSVLGAALGAVTQRIQIRAGSVVLPLHDPIRVVEEWSIVDNLSQGRVGLSFASGWNANDFVFAPDSYAERKNILRDSIDVVRKLWRGETITRRNGAGGTIEIATLPRPVQANLPVWLTSAGNIETFRQAGALGLNILTHLLGQSVEDLAAKIAAYRQAWHDHGHAPGASHVTLMLHTFVGDDPAYVRETIREPFTNYLRNSADLIQDLARGLGHGAEIETLDERSLQEVLDLAFERYVETSGLFGTPETCLALIEQLREIDIDEIACLIDFGVDPDVVLAHLPYLDQLRVASQPLADETAAGESLAARMQRSQVSHFQCTPSLARLLVDSEEAHAALGGLQQLLVGGEELSPGLAADLATLVPGSIHNMYGPTETTIWSTTGLVQRDVPVTIGRPIANTDVVILDDYGRIAPLAVEGELYIGGVGVARGYYARPDLTAERFVPHPLSGQGSNPPGARLYHTGDRARWRTDGTLEYLGRRDGQVKLHGFRIETGEIEVALTRHPAVRQSIVAAHGSGPERRLVAYIVEQPSKSGDAAARSGDLEATLRRSLSDQLPAYMVPAIFVLLDSLPLLPNGKVDRQALPAPDSALLTPRVEYEEPQTPVEQMLADTWASLLGAARVGRHDNFFQLGGDSIRAIRVINTVAAAGITITPRQLFQNPTVAALAAVATTSDAVRDQRAPTRTLPLTPMLHWLSEQQLSAPDHFNQAILLACDTPLDPDVLQQALNLIVAHHEALRLRLEPVDGGWQPMIADADTPVPLTIRSVRDETALAATIETVGEQLHASLNLRQGPIFRAALVQAGSGACHLLLVAHQLAVDVTSWDILRDDLQLAYIALAQARPLALTQVPASYRAWAESLPTLAQLPAVQAEARVAGAALPVQDISVPCDRDDGTNSYANIRTWTITLPPPETTALLQQACQTYRMESAELLITALERACVQQWGVQDLLVDLAWHDRAALASGSALDLSRTVGWLTIVAPAYLHSPATETIVDSLRRVKEQLRQIPKRGRSYGMLRYLEPGAEPAAPTVNAQISFTYLGHMESGPSSQGGWKQISPPVVTISSPDNERRYLIEVVGWVADSQLHVAWNYSAARHTEQTIRSLAAAFVGAVQSIIGHDQPPGTSVLTPSDFPLAGVNSKDLDTITRLLRKAKQS